MKVTSGKLQIGDVKHWKDGSKQIIGDDKESDLYPNKLFGDGAIEWLLRKATDVKKITRKAPKPQERELGGGEVMQGGDIVRWINSGDVFMVIDPAGTWPGISAGCINSSLKQVYRPITSARISRREYKRRVNKALEYLDQCQGSVVEDTIEILKGETQ